MREEEYDFWLCNVPNIGFKKINFLLKVFGSSKELYHTKKEELEKLVICGDDFETKLSSRDMNNIIISREEEKIRRAYETLEHKGIRFLFMEDESYPVKLKNIYGAPSCLYVKGNLPDPQMKMIAVVGARECSEYGREIAKYLSGAMAKEGIGIISGMARGIDAAAHIGALNSKGKTYGILGCGVDICYPKENINLYMEMQKEGGIMSEFPVGTQPYSSNFPLRNRIISGLSDGILVIEAKEKSGSLITVDMGLEQGKNIYALPGRITDQLSIGCNNLIKMGAKLVASPQDIIEDFLENYYFNTNESDDKKNGLEDSISIRVYDSLNQNPKYIDEISRETKLSLDVLMEQLLLLELKGIVRQTLKNFYCKS